MRDGTCVWQQPLWIAVSDKLVEHVLTSTPNRLSQNLQEGHVSDAAGAIDCSMAHQHST